MNAGTLWSAVSFNAPLSGLLTDTTYYFQACVTTATGEVCDDILSFTPEAGTQVPTPTPVPSPGELFPEFSADRTVGMAPLEVLFTDETTGGKPVAWSWHFDKQTVETDNPFMLHTFDSPGLYTVVMVALNEERKPFTKSKSQYIDVGAPIQASFTHSTLKGKMPVEVWFTDTSKGSLDTWEWNFGPYGIQTIKNPRVVYETPGEYPVTLTVSSKKYGGEPVTTSTTIHVMG